MPVVRIAPLPPWMPAARLLGEGAWVEGPSGTFTAELPVPAAADVAARLRGLGFDGTPLTVEVSPPLPRAAVRAARTEDARRRRDTTPGFTRGGARLDEEGRWSLTPEALALEMGRALAERHPGATVLDAGCGAGGNTIGFARAGLRVIAVERDPGRLAMARSNATLYGVADRIRFLVGDATTFLSELNFDVLFCDPPWGVDWDRAVGPSLPLLDTLAARRPLWAKVPPSFDTRRFPDATVEPWFGRRPGDHRRVKFLLLRLPTT